MTQRRCTILLVEEEPILREITTFRLQLLDYEVISWEGANLANEWLQSQLPQLIVVGQVAETSALEFLNQLSNEPRTCEVPVIFLSSSSDLEDVQKAYNAGADDFLVSPFDPLTLEKKVEDLIGASRAVRT